MEGITGTLVHYVKICPRKVWLMAHELGPDEDHPLLELGRFLGERAYPRERLRSVTLPGMVLDWVRVMPEGELLVAEVKKSGRVLDAARLQLLFYLKSLREQGLQVRGEIRIIQQRRRIPVELDREGEQELKVALDEVRAIIRLSLPPPPRQISHCRGCAYAEFCWADLGAAEESGLAGPKESRKSKG